MFDVCTILCGTKDKHHKNSDIISICTNGEFMSLFCLIPLSRSSKDNLCDFILLRYGEQFSNNIEQKRSRHMITGMTLDR